MGGRDLSMTLLFLLGWAVLCFYNTWNLGWSFPTFLAAVSICTYILPSLSVCNNYGCASTSGRPPRYLWDYHINLGSDPLMLFPQYLPNATAVGKD
ncbi:hypothetical protein B0H66DRAFT_194083 [Apodospora peruviana]|uniref:Uncharacterized protein n=1 Tax=Apodospora peruviana TaxID=516989 RepID=A0AAE0M7W6_9PEZI|nr:hypothetical protein B0H66DRAFT_194083 [Apodospora peruviana]